MERKDVGTGNLTTSSQPQLPSDSSSLNIPSVGTCNYLSAATANHGEIPHAKVSKQNVTILTGTSFTLPVTSSLSSTRRVARRATKGGDAKTKTSSTLGDDAILVALTTKDSQLDDPTKESSFVSPGAVSVPGMTSSLVGSANNLLELVDSPIADRALSFVVAAQLINHHHNEDLYEQGEDLEQRIDEEVESRLQKRDPTLVVAEVVHPGTFTCKQFCWNWKYVVLLFIPLCIWGAIVGATFSARFDLYSTRDNESQARVQDALKLQARIKDVLERYVTVDERIASPQSRAREWLLRNDTNNLMQNGSVSDTVILERFVLASLFFSTSGDTWQNQLEFLTPATVCKWNNGSIVSAQGVLCDDDGNVQHIELSDNSLSGSIPSELSLLSNLQSLSLEFNALRKVVPTELGRLTALQVLSLGGNMLNGTLPTELGNLFALEILGLGNNQFTGTMPTELGRLTDLQVLEGYGNRMSGTFPTELGLMTSLTDIRLDHNKFAGTLPTELGRLTNLEAFSVPLNCLSGTLPTELDRWSNLELFSAACNILTGLLPTELGLMTSLTGISVDQNSFTGTIPTELGRLTDLQLFSMRSNVLRGSLPTELGLMTSLIYMGMSSNFFTGTLPTELGLLTSLTEISAEYNGFTGALPRELGQLTALANLTVYYNYLDGTIPEVLASNSMLQVDFQPQLRPEASGGK